MLKLVLSCLAVALLASNAGARVSWREQRLLQEAFGDLVGEGIINAIPFTLLEVFYGDVRVNPNDVYTTDQVVNPPTILFDIEPNCFYTVIFFGPDSPYANDTRWRSSLHYMNNNVNTNVPIAAPCAVSYYPFNPPYSFRARYVFLIFKQNGFIAEDFSSLDTRRQAFNVDEFRRNQTLYGPVAGNIMLVEQRPCAG